METRVVPVELLEEVEDALKTAAFDTVRSGEAKELMALADKLNEIHVRAHADRRAAQVKAAATQGHGSEEMAGSTPPSSASAAAPNNTATIKAREHAIENTFAERAEKAEATLALTIEGAGNHMVRAERAEDKLEKAERENADLRHDIQRSVQRNSELLAECYELKAKLARYEAAERESPEEPQHYIPVHFGNSAMIPCGKGGWIDSQDYDALRTYAIAWKVENDRTQQGLINYAREIVGLETALSSARAHQRELEPAAWIEHHKGGANLNWERVDNPYAKATPLYRARKDAP